MSTEVKAPSFGSISGNSWQFRHFHWVVDKSGEKRAQCRATVHLMFVCVQVTADSHRASAGQIKPHRAFMHSKKNAWWNPTLDVLASHLHCNCLVKLSLGSSQQQTQVLQRIATTSSHLTAVISGSIPRLQAAMGCLKICSILVPVLAVFGPLGMTLGNS